MQRKKRGLLGILLTICLLFTMAIPTWADDETDAVNKARNGVVQVLTGFTDKDNKFYAAQGGSGFLIGDQVLMTNYHVVNMTSDTRTEADAFFDQNW